VYLVYVVEGRGLLRKYCKTGLECVHVNNVVHDCKIESEGIDN
jgi:hypothetical protein